MNYFFALELPDDVRHELATQVNQWRLELDQLYPYRWVETRDYHITLKFLGDVSKAAVECAIEIGQPIAEAKQPFRVRLAAAGGFKKHRTSNIILWMGVRHNAELEELANALDDTLRYPNLPAPFGLPNTTSQQQYKPHITLARGNFSPEYFGYRMDYERPFPSWEVNRFVLMQTLPPQQRANGAKTRYNIVQTFPFGNAHSSDIL